MKRSTAGTGAATALSVAALLCLPACKGVQSKVGTGTDAGPTYGGDAGTEMKTLNEIAKAMLSFHTDTGGWPNGNTAWYATQPAWRRIGDVQLDGESFTRFDTAEFAQPPDIVACDLTHKGGFTDPCWQGPYLGGSKTESLGTDPWLDQWGRPLMHAYIRPADGFGGGIGGPTRPQAAKGLIFIWSLGKDGVDGFACSDGSCSLDIDAEAKGLPSNPKADDLVVQVGTAE